MASTASPGLRLCVAVLGNCLTAWRGLLSGRVGEPTGLLLHLLCSKPTCARPITQGPFRQALASASSCSRSPLFSELHPSVCVYYKKGRTTQQYVTGVIITSPTPIMPSAADLSTLPLFNHPPASLTLTEQQHRPCDLSARGHDL